MSLVVVKGALRWRADLERDGWLVKQAEDIAQVDRLLDREAAQCVVFRADGGNPQQSLGWTQSIRKRDTRLPVILVVAEGTEELAIAALRAGVTDYVPERAGAQELVRTIRRFHRAHNATGQPEAPRTLVGSSGLMDRVRRYTLKVARSPATVLITGETGSGKEVAAEMIRQESPRRPMPYVCINCAAIPDALWEGEMHGRERGAYTGADSAYDGKLRQADGGTLFLDEIGELNLALQAKFLRFLESREVQSLGSRQTDHIDVRVIAATNRDLEHDVRSGRFRADLYYRINVARVKLPPLRDHKEDLPEIIAHLLPAVNARLGTAIAGLTEDAVLSLIAHDWPGNVRELRNLLESAALGAEGALLTAGDFPDNYREILLGGGGAPRTERDELLSALVSTNWNKTAAAQMLQCSRMTVYRKMAQYQLRTRESDARALAVGA